jgi:heme oxygenase
MHPPDARASSGDTHSTHGRLRLATGEQHRRLDRGLDYVLSERLSTGRYVDLLEALFGFYAPLEESFRPWEAASRPLGLPLVRRAGLLHRDLRAFGRAPEHSPTCAELPVLATVDHLAGVIYVLEGACLGGQMIARALIQRHGIGRENGAAFFSGDGAQTAVRWKQVIAWLEERGRSRAARGEIVDGATATFAALSRWLGAREVLDG